MQEAINARCADYKKGYSQIKLEREERDMLNSIAKAIRLPFKVIMFPFKVIMFPFIFIISFASTDWHKADDRDFFTKITKNFFK